MRSATQRIHSHMHPGAVAPLARHSVSLDKIKANRDDGLRLAGFFKLGRVPATPSSQRRSPEALNP